MRWQRSYSTIFTLVIPDLRGYGESKGPKPDPEHQGYSKRAMAQDMVEVMSALGYEQFLLAGHDRGARVGYRLVLDHPERVLRFAALDIVPTLEVWERMNKDVAMRTYHWPFLAQSAPLPERLIGHDPRILFAPPTGAVGRASGGYRGSRVGRVYPAFQ